MKKIILFFLLLVFSSTQVKAETITAIPPRIELSGNPGETVNAQLKVRNDSGVTKNYSVSVEDFIVADTKGTPIPVVVPNSRWSLKQWITAPAFVPVDPNTSQTVNITVKIPKTAFAGGHFAMVLYTPSDALKAGEAKVNASAITQRVGTLLYVTVKGKVTESAAITRFTIPKINEFGPINISGAIESVSDVHVNPKGSISIHDPISRKIADLPLEVGNIFPNTERDFNILWEQKWGWGRYRADLNLKYGSAGNHLTASTYFWLFPVTIVIYGLILVISSLVVIILLNKKAHKHQEELEKEVKELKKELDRMVK